MKQLLCILVMFVSFWACKPAEVKVESKLTDEQLAHLMLDIQFSEAALPEFSKARQDSLKELFFRQFSKIYKLSEVEIQEEVRMLEEDPDRLKLVLARVKTLADSLR